MEPSVTLSSTQSIEQSTSKATPRKPHMFSNTLSGTLQEYPYESPGTRPAGFESTFTEAERDFVRVNHRVDEDDKQKKRRRAANVSGHEDTLGKSQVTVTLNESNPPGSLCISQLMLNEVGMHPWDFGSTLRMVRAIRGAVQARQDTLEKTKIPHRDVSISNVMSNEGTVLIDSDSSKLDSYIPMRTGTRAFMSALLLRALKSGKHSRADDLESFFQLLCWITLVYGPHRLNDEEVSEMLAKVYDCWGECVSGLIGKGTRKVMMFIGRDMHMAKEAKLSEGPLKDLIVALEEVLAVRYQGPSRCQWDSFEQCKAIPANAEYAPLLATLLATHPVQVYLDSTEKLTRSGWMLELFDKAIAKLAQLDQDK